MADDNIFQQYLRAPKSVAEYSAEYDLADARQQEVKKNALELAAGQQKYDEGVRTNQENALVRAAVQRLGSGATDEQRSQAMRDTGTMGGYAAADAVAKAASERRKATASAAKDEASTDNSTFELRIKKSDQAMKDIAGFSTPQESIANLQKHAAAGDIPADQAQMILQSIPQDPAKFPAWQLGMLKNIMSAKEQMMAHLEEAKQQEQTRQFGLTEGRIKSEGAANRNNQIKVQNMIGERQDKAGADPDGMLPEETLSQMAQQYRAGDTSVMQNLGRGAQGAKNIIRLRNEIAKQTSAEGKGGADLAAQNAEYFGTKAGQRSAGTRIANVEMAANEAESLIPLARTASENVARSGLLPFGKAQVMFNNQTNDPNLRKFVAANNALVNVYSRAISPSGVPTVHDKEHARAMLSEAMDQPSYNAVLDQMQEEITAARAAPQAVRKAFNDAVTGKGGHATPPVNKPALPKGWKVEVH